MDVWISRPRYQTVAHSINQPAGHHSLWCVYYCQSSIPDRHTDQSFVCVQFVISMFHLLVGQFGTWLDSSLRGMALLHVGHSTLSSFNGWRINLEITGRIGVCPSIGWRHCGHWRCPSTHWRQKVWPQAKCSSGSMKRLEQMPQSKLSSIASSFTYTKLSSFLWKEGAQAIQPIQPTIHR